MVTEVVYTIIAQSFKSSNYYTMIFLYVMYINFKIRHYSMDTKTANEKENQDRENI